MLPLDWFILMGLGAFFALLGFGLTLGGKSEETRFYTGLSHDRDAKGYLEESPTSLKVGGRISLVLGIGALVAGAVMALLGKVF